MSPLPLGVLAAGAGASALGISMAGARAPGRAHFIPIDEPPIGTQPPSVSRQGHGQRFGPAEGVLSRSGARSAVRTEA